MNKKRFLLLILLLSSSAMCFAELSEKEKLGVECLMREGSMDGLSRAVWGGKSREEVSKSVKLTLAKRQQQHLRVDAVYDWYMGLFDEARHSKQPDLVLKNYEDRLKNCRQHPDDVLGDHAFVDWKDVHNGSDLP